ncbi:hypothetical protein [Arthrobacter sp. YC-RL1]|uniref:hypothetical protein n=1 Tax=Arthrobacter sp. YC-RL1 TaxID=1652545 RepID=UPI00128E0412|nr:hypothetical protein [Arthrobacter sp. YC-RL1]
MAHIEQLSRDKAVTPSIEILARFCANTQIIICSLPKRLNYTLPGIGSNFHISIPSAHDGSAGHVGPPLRNPLPNAMPANNEVSAHLLK